MEQIDVMLLEIILHECKEVDPNPWYPRRTAWAPHYTWEQIKAAIERLWLNGFLEPVVGDNPEDRAFGLTRSGLHLLESPTALESFKEKIDREQNDPAVLKQSQAVKETFQKPVVPFVRRAFLWLNIFIFAYGLYLANQRNVPLGDFAMGRNKQAVKQILEDTGMVQRADFARGDYWRLLTACFVHGGIFHILMNMYALFMVGRDVERMYGHWRFALIYLIAGFGGSCAGIYTTNAVVGASGAICGLIAAVAVWLILNKKHLPPKMVTANLWNLMFVALMITLISMMPQVSGAGHLGGAVVGGITAILLHYQRFARSVAIQVIAGLVALSLPALCILGFKQVTAKDDNWQRLNRVEGAREGVEALQQYRPLHDELGEFYEKELLPVLEVSRFRRDRIKDKVTAVLKQLPEKAGRAKNAQNELDAMGPFPNVKVERNRKGRASYFRVWHEWLLRMKTTLEQNRQWTRREERAMELFLKRWPDKD